jgi:hypothetical protein
MMRKRVAVQGLGRHCVVKRLRGTQIPVSIKALIKVARAPRGPIAARYAAKSQAA